MAPVNSNRLDEAHGYPAHWPVPYFFLGINLSLILGDYYFSQVDRKIRLRLKNGEGHEKNNINDNDHADDRRRSSDGFRQ
jgi:hypothetical protein